MSNSIASISWPALTSASAVAAACRASCTGSRSSCARRMGSLSDWKASEIRAISPLEEPATSGWCCRALDRYASFNSSAVASRRTPRTVNGQSVAAGREHLGRRAAAVRRRGSSMPRGRDDRPRVLGPRPVKNPQTCEVKSSQVKSEIGPLLLIYLFSEGTYVSTYDVSPLMDPPPPSPPTPVLPCWLPEHIR